jgi:chromosome segregation ATPase
MIEQIMFFGLGAMIAGLFALVIIPLVHARAVRLTKRRIEAAAPISIAEVQADKDQLRAEFAMSTRRLEISVDQLRTKTAAQLADLGSKNEQIKQLKAELKEKTTALASLETRDKTLIEKLRVTEEELGGKNKLLQQLEQKLAERDAEIVKLNTTIGEQTVTADSQRIEIVALKTQIATLQDQITDLEQQLKHTQGRLAQERADGERLTKQLVDERSKIVTLTTRVGELEGIEKDLREELAARDRRHAAATEAIRKEKAVAEEQLELAREERAKVLRDMATLTRETEATWATERVENALLRERINDVSAEVARLTATLEGPGSAINTLLAADEIGSPRNGKGAQNGSGPITVSPGSGTLADRIRALQNRAARDAAST